MVQIAPHTLIHRTRLTPDDLKSIPSIVIKHGISQLEWEHTSYMEVCPYPFVKAENDRNYVLIDEATVEKADVIKVLP